MSDTIPPGEPPQLSGHEIICMSDIARGISINQTATRLGICERDVGFHIDSAINKLGANSRSHAVAKALSLGLISMVLN